MWLPNPESFFRAFVNWKFLVTLAALLLGTDWLGHRWLFERTTLAGTDVLLGVTKPRPAEHCRLVTINELEFNRYLGEWLQPEKLTEVLRAILAYEPKVLVVDIDTSAPRFRKLEVPASKSRIVWARVSRQELTSTGGAKRSYIWKAGEVLGNRPSPPEYVGSPLFPQDPDGTVRSFQRVVSIDANAESLHCAILRAYCDAQMKQACAVVQPGRGSEPGGRDAADAEAARVRPFQADWEFPAIPLSDLMPQGGSAKPHPGELGDVVLLGATFSDIHPTSFGPKLGIELLASAVETELAGESRPWPVYGWSRWLVKILLALAVVWLNTRLMPMWAAGGTLVLLALVFVASFLGIYYGLFRMEFLPFMLGIWIEQLVEGSERAQQRTHGAT